MGHCSGGTRTHVSSFDTDALPSELQNEKVLQEILKSWMVPAGIEPATSTLLGWRCYQTELRDFFI